MFTFNFSHCYTPVIESISTNRNTTTTLEIKGTGFGDTLCQNVIKIGDYNCVVEKANSTYIKCTIDTEATLLAGYRLTVILLVNNRGLAQNVGTETGKHIYTLVPRIDSISRTEGSMEGGTQIEITGHGFSVQSIDGVQITIGGAVCIVESATYTMIVCKTTKVSEEGKYPVLVVVNNIIQAWCAKDSNCNFTYSWGKTPEVTAVSTTTVSGPATDLVITGTGFGTDTANVMVTVGGVVCVVSTVSATEIACVVGNVPGGEAMLKVVISPEGQSAIENVILESATVISSLHPTEGSGGGGQVVTIQGNGFCADKTTVAIGPRDCEIISVTLSEIKCRTPIGYSVKDVIVTSCGIVYPKQTYSFSKTPSIFELTPTSGKSGDTLTLATGMFDKTTYSRNSITINGVECIITSIVEVNSNRETVECTVGVVPAGPHTPKGHVDNLGNLSNNLQFTYDLSISNMSPSPSESE